MRTSEAARRRANVILQAEGAPTARCTPAHSPPFAASSVSRPKASEETPPPSGRYFVSALRPNCRCSGEGAARTSHIGVMHVMGRATTDRRDHWTCPSRRSYICPHSARCGKPFLTYVRDAFLLDNLIHVVNAPASFDIPQAHGRQSAKPFTAVQAPQHKRTTYIVRAKM